MSLEKTGEKIKILRTKFGLTQKEIANALKVDRSTYTYYELGKTTPNWHTINKLAQIFQVDPYDLLEKQNGYIMSDISSKDGKNISICNLNSDEKKIVLALRTMSLENKNKAINLIKQILEDLKK